MPAKPATLVVALGIDALALVVAMTVRPIRYTDAVSCQKRRRMTLEWEFTGGMSPLGQRTGKGGETCVGDTV